MRIQPANISSSSKSMLLELMRESHLMENSATPAEWAKTEAAITILLDDPQAGVAYLILNETGEPVGYMIMCRGFSLDYGGYFTWIEETYLRKADQKRFRDQRFSP